MGQVCSSAERSSCPIGETDSAPGCVEAEPLSEAPPVKICRESEIPLWKQQADADNERMADAVEVGADMERLARGPNRRTSRPSTALSIGTEPVPEGGAPDANEIDDIEAPKPPEAAKVKKATQKRPGAKAASKRKQRTIPSFDEWTTEHRAAWDALSQADKKTRACEAVEAAKRNEIDTVLQLIATGTKVNVADFEGRSCIRTASREGHAELVDTILKMGGKVNGLNTFSKDCALHLACKFKRWQVVVLLVQSGADVTIKNMQGQTPVDVCSDEKLAKWMSGNPLETPPP